MLDRVEEGKDKIKVWKREIQKAWMKEECVAVELTELAEEIQVKMRAWRKKKKSKKKNYPFSCISFLPDTSLTF